MKDQTAGFYDVALDPAFIEETRRFWFGEESAEKEIRRKLRNKRKAWKRKYGR